MITIHRGTNKELVISLKDDANNEYKLSDTENLIFGVKDNVKNNYIFSKVIQNDSFNATQGGYLLELKPEDTQNMAFGQYVYDIGLQKDNGEFYIVVPCNAFIVAETVTERMI
jgi:hypothetical protein